MSLKAKSYSRKLTPSKFKDMMSLTILAISLHC